MTGEHTRRRIVILGAGGRDFHDFLTLYRDDDHTDVIAFTATQIPGIAGRKFPASLAGPRYPDGIPIIEEDQLERICRDQAINDVVCAYSDLRHEDVMHLASRAIAAGARFVLAGARQTMIASQKPVIAVSAVRTGCGKSQTTRYLSEYLNARHLKNVLVRHPMPYGDLARQAVQRFETIEDLKRADCTIEEREEYEPHLRAGTIVYAGVDYREILREVVKSSARRRPRQMLSCGTAETTTFPSFALTSTLSSSTPCGPTSLTPIIRARPCCAWLILSLSTK
jgi:predicted GTPase